MLLHIISDCNVDLLSAFMALAHSEEIERKLLDGTGYFLHDFSAACAVDLSERTARDLKRGHTGADAFVRTSPAAALSYVREHRQAGKCLYHAHAV